MRYNILNDFMKNLKQSGYDVKERMNILKSGYKTYENLKEKTKDPFTDFNSVERKVQEREKKYIMVF